MKVYLELINYKNNSDILKDSACLLNSVVNIIQNIKGIIIVDMSSYLFFEYEYVYYILHYQISRISGVALNLSSFGSYTYGIFEDIRIFTESPKTISDYPRRLPNYLR